MSLIRELAQIVTDAENEYKRLLAEKTAEYELPVLCNINIGHALPRCIIPFGVTAEVDAEKQTISFA